MSGNQSTCRLRGESAAGDHAYTYAAGAFYQTTPTLKKLALSVERNLKFLQAIPGGGFLASGRKANGDRVLFHVDAEGSETVLANDFFDKVSVVDGKAVLTSVLFKVGVVDLGTMAFSWAQTEDRISDLVKLE